MLVHDAPADGIDIAGNIPVRQRAKQRRAVGAVSPLGVPRALYCVSVATPSTTAAASRILPTVS